jgi:hypothetical protein
MTPEESTVRLYHRLEDGMGKDIATVLVENFATKDDIAKLVTDELNQAMAELRMEMSNMELRLYRFMFTGATALIATNLALYGGLVATGR